MFRSKLALVHVHISAAIHYGGFHSFRHDFPVKGIDILTSTNVAYELAMQGQAGEGYEMVDIPPRGPSAANIEGMYEVPLPPPSQAAPPSHTSPSSPTLSPARGRRRSL